MHSPLEPSCPPCAADALVHPLVGFSLAEVERGLILGTVGHCAGNRTRAAKLLGISVRTLHNKLGAYAADGLTVPEPWQARGAI